MSFKKNNLTVLLVILFCGSVFSQCVTKGDLIIKEDAEKFGYPFPYLYDETQDVAKTYKAACTPDLYLFDENRKLYYRGQFDDARPRNDIKPTGKDLRNATDRMLAGKSAPEKQIPSIGCNIKWKKGNEPDYFG